MRFANLRTALFWIHFVIGCLAGVVILVMSVTGMLLTYERQVIRWVDRDFRTPSDSPRLPVEAMLQQVVARSAATPSAISIRSDPAAPAEVSFGRDRVFLIDTHTGNLLGESAPRTRFFFEQVENWHRWLGTGSKQRAVGRALTGACNLGFLVLVVSGPFLWIPNRWSWRSVKSRLFFRGGLAGRARDFNWHNVIGIWSAVPLVLIVMSGVVMSYPWANNLLHRLTGNEPAALGPGPRPEQRQARREHMEASLAGLNSLWLRAEQQVPGWRSVTLRMAPSGRGPLTFTIDTGAGGRPDQRSQLTLDRRSGEVVRWEPFSTYNAGRRLRGWFRFIHTGEAGGIAGQTIAGLASTGAVVMVWTGLCLACRRLFRRKSRAKPAATEEDRAMAVQV
jgi:uncharacterized iron-regulated membrane protein